MTGQKEKTEILDLAKWTAKTTESVRHVLEKAGMPCVGFSLVFLNPLNKEEIDFQFKTMLVGEPNQEIDEQSKKDMEQAFEFLAEGVKRIMLGEFRSDTLKDYTATGSLH